MLDNLAVVLFKPKFPENIGSAARACVNMGCGELIVVAPRKWDVDRMKSLATVKGLDLINRTRVVDDLPTALAGFTHAYGTTARTGGWRKGILPPTKAAEMITEERTGGGSVALVFGPEDRGLTNAETEVCSQLVRIPTDPEASSLNLAQAVLVMLYECRIKGSSAPPPQQKPKEENMITHDEQELLFGTMQKALRAIDFIKDQNQDYWMLPVRRFLQRTPVKRPEFNMLMGICRQVQWIAGKARGDK